MASGHEKVPHQQAGHMAAPTSRASPSEKPLPTGSRPHMALNGPQSSTPPGPHQLRKRKWLLRPHEYPARFVVGHWSQCCLGPLEPEVPWDIGAVVPWATGARPKGS
jgi:hypothetical protein